jgi:hypothetical protein
LRPDSFAAFALDQLREKLPCGWRVSIIALEKIAA